MSSQHESSQHAAALQTTAPFKLRRIAFVPAQQSDAVPVPQGLDLVVLNERQPQHPNAGSDAMRPNGVPRSGGSGAGTAEPRKLRKPQDDLALRWRTVQKMGAGLQNLGNTCFMNAVLQCLTHTPPLAEALLATGGRSGGTFRRSIESAPRTPGGVDPLALTAAHIERSLRHRTGVLSPVAHVKTLRSVSKSFRTGRQEDAHEYLIALLDAMHTMALGGPGVKVKPEAAANSLIYRIFAGKMRSTVKCTECQFESCRSDPFLDISLEINRASSVARAMQRFTAAEYLEGDNKYKCPKQRKAVRAAKRMAIEEAPAVLVLQLKRFEFTARSRTKLGKRVDFELQLDLAPFMADRRGPARPYTLFGVLVHHGHSLHAGHYVAFVRGPNGLWHQMDDASVSQVSERIVLAQKAYILFYIRDEANVASWSAAPAFQPTPQHPARGMANGGADAAPASAPAQPNGMPANGVSTPAMANGTAAPASAPPAGKRRMQEADGNAAEAQPTAKRRKAADGSAKAGSTPAAGRAAAGGAAVDGGEGAPAAALGSGAGPGPPPVSRLLRSTHALARAFSLSQAALSPFGRSFRRLELHKAAAHVQAKLMMSRAASKDHSPSPRGGSPTVAAQHAASGSAAAGGMTAAAKAASASRLGKGRHAAEKAAAAAAVEDAAAQPSDGGSSSDDESFRPSGSDGSDSTSSSSSGLESQPADSGGGGDSLDAGADGSSGADTSSGGSVPTLSESPAVEAPPWPPFGSGAAVNVPAASGGTPANAATGSKAAASAAQPGEPRAATGAQAAALLSGDGAVRWQDAAEADAADQLLRKSQPQQLELDEYDAEYDRGRTKKVKQKRLGNDAGLAASLQQSFATRKRHQPQDTGRSRGRSSPGRGGRGRGGRRGFGRGRHSGGRNGGHRGRGF